MGLELIEDFTGITRVFAKCNSDNGAFTLNERIRVRFPLQ